MTSRALPSFGQKMRHCGLSALLALSTLTLSTAWATDDREEDAASSRQANKTVAGPGLRYGAEALRIEGMHLVDQARAQSAGTVRASWFASMKATAALEWRIGLRTDLDSQKGAAGYNDSQIGWSESWLRWRNGDARITGGMQTILWGRVDGVSLIDRVGRVDLRRFALDDLKERRLPQPALRWEHDWGDYKSDLVLLAGFQNALLPDRRNIWHPINRFDAQVIGTAPAPALTGFYAAAPLQQSRHGSGGAALRITHAGDGFDYGLTLGRTRQTLPFFQLDPAGGRIQSSQPFVRFVAADAEWVAGGITWRGEIAHNRDLPMTALSGGPLQAHSTDLAGGLEFFPGGRDTRVNLQVLWRSVATGGEATVELQRYAAVSGELESSFEQGVWKAALRFSSALTIHDLYLSPRLSYMGWEPHEVYLSGHVFQGSARSYGGFMRRNDSVALGLKMRF